MVQTVVSLQAAAGMPKIPALYSGTMAATGTTHYGGNRHYSAYYHYWLFPYASNDFTSTTLFENSGAYEALAGRQGRYSIFQVRTAIKLFRARVLGDRRNLSNLGKVEPTA